VVDLSDRRAYVYKGDLVIASYPVAVGKKGWETPTGSFAVMNMQHDPIWQHPITGKVFPPGNDSPLGERWIGFWTDGRNEIGFHGTPDIHLLGTAISHGCLRMRNSDVRLLYDQVKVGTLVKVRE
jgi:lipoprotein-anchoring transpeptidase ErfK/SrfK